MVDFESLQTVQTQLEPGEQLLWYGQPDPKRVLPATIPVVLFGIPWTSFALFWMAGAAGFKFPDFSGPLSFFPLFGLPFVLIGLGMLSSPYWAYRKAQRTIYAITNRRALIIVAGRSKRIQSYSSDDIGIIERVERANGAGDITFATDTDTNKARQKIGFFGIPDARRVERLLLDTFKNDDDSSAEAVHTNRRASVFN